LAGGDFLVRVKKRSEEFDKAKLELSLEKAGARHEHATEVAETVAHKAWEGMTTAEIRQLATTELRRMNPKAATVYETSKNR